MALRHYSDHQVCGLLAEAVHSKVSNFAATVASYFLSCAPATVGSLYSGAFDELGDCYRAMEMLTPTATGSKPQATARLTFITSLGRCVDTELSLLGEKPKFGNHGNRRKADEWLVKLWT